MKKQFLAKLLALGLVLGLLPTAAFAARIYSTTAPGNNIPYGYENNQYYWYAPDVSYTPSAPTESAAPAYTVENGAVKVDGTATLAAADVEAILAQLKDGEALTFATTGDTLKLTLPGTVLAKMGRDLVITTPFASITVPADDLATLTAEKVEFASEAGDDVVVTVTGDGANITDTLKGIVIE